MDPMRPALAVLAIAASAAAASCPTLALAAPPAATITTDQGTTAIPSAFGCIRYVIPEPPGFRPGVCAALSSEVTANIGATRGSSVQVQIAEPYPLLSPWLAGPSFVLQLAAANPGSMTFQVPPTAPADTVLRFGVNWSGPVDSGDAYYAIRLNVTAPPPVLTVESVRRTGRQLAVTFRASRDGQVRFRWRTGGRTRAKAVPAGTTARTIKLAVRRTRTKFPLTATLTTKDDQSTTTTATYAVKG